MTNDDKKTSSTLKWIIGSLIAVIAAGGGATAYLRYLEEKHLWPFTQSVIEGQTISDTFSLPATGKYGARVPHTVRLEAPDGTRLVRDTLKYTFDWGMVTATHGDLGKPSRSGRQTIG
jgi:hypothetical protein